jgi:carbon-monoxide dehydrogenase medium subunit
VAQHFPVVRESLQHVAHLAIRNVGTIGGSLPLAGSARGKSPPFCWCAFWTQRLSLSRFAEKGELPREIFFISVFTTAIQPDELLAKIEFPFCLGGGRICLSDQFSSSPWSGYALAASGSLRLTADSRLCSAGAMNRPDGGGRHAATQFLGAESGLTLRTGFVCRASMHRAIERGCAALTPREGPERLILIIRAI